MTIQNPLTLSVDEIYQLTNYAHWIPISKGYADEYIDEKYPGWEWNQLIPTLIDRKILFFGVDQSASRQLLQGLSISAEVKEVIYKVDKVGRLHIKVINGETSDSLNPSAESEL